MFSLESGGRGGAFERQLIVMGVDQLRKPQRTSHPGRAAADDDDIRLHLWPFDALNWLAEVNHGFGGGLP